MNNDYKIVEEFLDEEFLDESCDALDDDTRAYLISLHTTNAKMRTFGVVSVALATFLFFLCVSVYFHFAGLKDYIIFNSLGCLLIFLSALLTIGSCFLVEKGIDLVEEDRRRSDKLFLLQDKCDKFSFLLLFSGVIFSLYIMTLAFVS